MRGFSGSLMEEEVMVGPFNASEPRLPGYWIDDHTVEVGLFLYGIFTNVDYTGGP